MMKDILLILTERHLNYRFLKPCDLSGENVQGIEDPVVGLATMWDQYKTLYPLLFLLYPDMGRKLARTLVSISRVKGINEKHRFCRCFSDPSDQRL